MPATPHRPLSGTQRLTALVATIFGILTLVAGGRILLGMGEAGYTVVRPVLIFNVVMGVMYLLAAATILRDVSRGRLISGLIALASVLVLVSVLVMRATGGAVADQTLAAMALRSGVWLAITLALGRARRLAAGSRTAARSQ